MTAPTGDAVLAELKKITAQLVKQNQTQEKLLKSVQNLEYLVNGYTSGGASFNGYLPDSFLTAYISILGPALSQKMAVGESDLEEMMKGATILAKRLLEELAARSRCGSEDDQLHRPPGLLDEIITLPA